LTDEVCFTTDPADLWRSRPDLIVECAGPQALASLGAAALSVADVWTVSASALADPRLLADLEARAHASGHRLRVLPGAIAGLDGIAALTAGGETTLDLCIDLPPGPGTPATLFTGSVREAAQRYPDGVNVAVAAAMAGPGLDASRIEVSNPGQVSRHALAFNASGRTGRVRMSIEPDITRGMHPVAASIIAALRQATAVVWVG
jgi:aspartate dehydrogenase